jgi:L-lysine 6-transaminase
MQNEQLEVYAINSGAEAVENMLKYFINLYDQKQLSSGKSIRKRRFIYFDQAFHGRTVFALNITRLQHAPVITKDFEGLIENIEVPFPATDNSQSASWHRQQIETSLRLTEQALQLGGDEIVGIVVEPIQGAGGHRVADKQFFQRLSELAHTYDVYLGFDEVQTAGGQAGSVFAVDLLDLPYPPQGIATGKKFGMGVVYMLYPMQDLGVLDSTWGGSLCDMVRFCQEWKIVEEENLISSVPERAHILVRGLADLANKYPLVLHNVRGMGLYQGFSLRSPYLRDTLLDRALDEEHLLMLGAASDSIRLRPALDITSDEIDKLLCKLDNLLRPLADDAKCLRLNNNP